ncbi:hypothetical protein BH160DRAFT_0078 [Burkholderia sp. H160]|nr:hypothetical protein BH160DRAFT_0078 [Burkholderia sp. H160]
MVERQAQRQDAMHGGSTSGRHDLFMDSARSENRDGGCGTTTGAAYLPANMPKFDKITVLPRSSSGGILRSRMSARIRLSPSRRSVTSRFFDARRPDRTITHTKPPAGTTSATGQIISQHSTSSCGGDRVATGRETISSSWCTIHKAIWWRFRQKWNSCLMRLPSGPGGTKSVP